MTCHELLNGTGGDDFVTDDAVSLLLITNACSRKDGEVVGAMKIPGSLIIKQ